MGFKLNKINILNKHKNKDKKQKIKDKKVKKEKQPLTRNSNLELLRIVSMLFIVCFHTIIHGGVLVNSQNNTLSTIVFIIELITLVHVNSFALVTGYFQSEKKEIKMSKVWSLLNSSLFYKATIMIILLACGYITVSKVDFLKNLSIIPLDSHWFIRTFIPLYLFSPFINKLINSMNQKEYLGLLGITLVIISVIPFIWGGLSFPNSGLSLYQLVYLYLVGGYLKKYPLEKSYLFKKCSKQLFQIILVSIIVACVGVNFLFYVTVFLLKDVNSVFNYIFSTMSGSILWYSNPFVIIQSVAYFLFFNTLNIKSRLINLVSSLTFGVYLIHENWYIRPLLYTNLGINRGPIYSTKFVIYMLLMVCVIFVVCAFIEFCRQQLFKFIRERKISIKIRSKFNDFVRNIKIVET